MTAMIVGLLICLVLSVAVMALVAIPARREGREILTARGERVVVRVRATTDSATSRASGAVASASGKRPGGHRGKRGETPTKRGGTPTKRGGTPTKRKAS